MKAKLVLVIRPDGVIDTGQFEGGAMFPCLDAPQEAVADKLLSSLATKHVRWCG
jgi:hypothetical protein